MKCSKVSLCKGVLLLLLIEEKRHRRRRRCQFSAETNEKCLSTEVRRGVAPVVSKLKVEFKYSTVKQVTLVWELPQLFLVESASLCNQNISASGTKPGFNHLPSIINVCKTLVYEKENNPPPVVP